MRINHRIKIDDKAVQRAVDKAMKPTLMGAGRYVMNIVRASLHQRKNPDQSSAPGRPPFSHASPSKMKKHPKFNPGFKRTIVYAMEESGKAVLVGPMLVRPGMSEIAKSHEFGGRRKVTKYWHEEMDVNNFKAGTMGPVRKAYISRKDSIVSTDPDVDPKTGEQVYWIRLRTAGQVKHSQRVFKRMAKVYTKTTFSRGKYPPRPFMLPGLIHAQPKLAAFWRNAVKK